jgi:hypothetical protein
VEFTGSSDRVRLSFWERAEEIRAEGGGSSARENGSAARQDCQRHAAANARPAGSSEVRMGFKTMLTEPWERSCWSRLSTKK